MDLRGLSWPCSVSQLGAIFVMALVWALIRRRLGKIPFFCRAPPGHELDFLATRIVFYPDFRDFDNARDNGYLKEQVLYYRPIEGRALRVLQIRKRPNLA